MIIFEFVRPVENSQIRVKFIPKYETAAELSIFRDKPEI